MARTRNAPPAEPEKPAATSSRRSRNAAPAEPAKDAAAPSRRSRTAAPAETAPAATSRRSRNSAAAPAEAPADKGGKKAVVSPRRKLNVAGRNRRTPAEDANDAVKILVQSALNANPELDVVTSGQLNLLIMGAGLAASSAEASVIWQKAVTAGTVVEV